MTIINVILYTYSTLNDFERPRNMSEGNSVNGWAIDIDLNIKSKKKKTNYVRVCTHKTFPCPGKRTIFSMRVNF